MSDLPSLNAPDPAEIRLYCERCERLAARLMEQLLPELSRFPPQPNNVFVVLNALAFTAATVLAGTDRNGRRFFEKALAENIRAVRNAEESGPLRPNVVGHA